MGKKYNNLKRENIVKYWKNNIGDRKINTTWDNALNCCWACGINAGSLQRAHIIPESLGGPMTESNMVLLCTHCHGQNPETIHAEYFWLWIKGRIKLKEEYNKRLFLPSTEHEHILMFGERTLNNGEELEAEIYFGEENMHQASYHFFRKKKDEYIQRYTSSITVMAHLFHLHLRYLLEKYKLNDKDPEVQEFFPHIYGMGEIKREEVLSHFSNSDSEDEIKDDETEEKRAEELKIVKRPLSVLIRVE